MLQSVWYIPAGLDIWNQLRGKYPGRYATMKGMIVPPPSYGPVVWNHDQDPIVEGSGFEERLHAHMIATMSGDVSHSYGLFLGLAADRSRTPARPRSVPVPGSHRSSGYDRRPEGQEHRSQGAESPRGASSSPI